MGWVECSVGTELSAVSRWTVPGLSWIRGHWLVFAAEALARS